MPPITYQSLQGASYNKTMFASVRHLPPSVHGIVWETRLWQLLHAGHRPTMFKGPLDCMSIVLVPGYIYHGTGEISFFQNTDPLIISTIMNRQNNEIQLKSR